MNIWKPIIGDNLQTRPEPEDMMETYAVAILKDKQFVGHLTKEKFGRYAKTIFYFLRANQSSFAIVTVKGKELIMEMDKV